MGVDNKSILNQFLRLVIGIKRIRSLKAIKTVSSAYLVKTHGNPTATATVVTKSCITRARRTILTTHKAANYSFIENWYAQLKLILNRSTNNLSTGKMSTITIPESVRGMKILDKRAFTCSVQVPSLQVPLQRIGRFTKHSQHLSVLKKPGVKPIVDLDSNDPHAKTHKLLLLHPDEYSSESSFSWEVQQIFSANDVDISSWKIVDLILEYENWTHSEILKAILPEESDGVSGFSQIGHIVHLNLKDELLDYKEIIGIL